MGGLFTNGNARITRLIIIQLGLSCFSIALIQIQGFLPSLGLNPVQLRWAAFIIATTLTLIKSGEMFFNKVATLFKTGDAKIPPAPPGATEILTKP